MGGSMDGSMVFSGDSDFGLTNMFASTEQAAAAGASSGSGDGGGSGGGGGRQPVALADARSSSRGLSQTLGLDALFASTDRWLLHCKLA